MELKRIESNTSITDFGKDKGIYNSNNELIVNYITYLENKINALTTKLEQIETRHKNKILQLNSKITTLNDEAQKIAQIEFTKKYNALLDKYNISLED